MTRQHSLCAAAALVVACLAAPATAQVVTLIRDDFSDGAVGPTPAAGNWVNSSGSPEVAAGTGFATARGLATTYDHDNNASTANVNIPGGLEVNVSAVSTQTITVTMPVTINPGTFGQLTFWAAVRANNATGASVSVVDTTDAVTVLAATTPTFAPTNTNWQFNSFTFPLLASYAGDTFNVVFSGGGSNGANGLELTDITFAVGVVPEPSTFALAGLAAAGLAFRRTRRRGLADVPVMVVPA